MAVVDLDERVLAGLGHKVGAVLPVVCALVLELLAERILRT